MSHECQFGGWGHPVPPEQEHKLQGPEVGQIVRYAPQNESYKHLVNPNGIVRIKQRSYVWSPGECTHKGGYRRYDWKVIEWPRFNADGTIAFSTMVVDDKDLKVLG